MKRFRVSLGHYLHGEKGRLAPGDEIPETWLNDDAREVFLEAGSIEEIKEEPPAPSAAVTSATPDTGVELIERKRGQRK